MKKLSIFAMALLGLVGLSACDSDRDDNPTLQVPSSFELLQPSIGSNVIDLASSTSIELPAKQAPDYGFPTQVTYSAEMGVGENVDWNDSTQVYAIDGSTNSITVPVSASEVNKGVIELSGITSEENFDPTATYVVSLRLKAQLLNDTDGSTTVYSNAVAVNVKPYFEVYGDAEPVVWFMIGGCIGDGKWSNNQDGVGPSMVPMWTIPGEEYDPKTGEGVIEYVGYFPAGAKYKIVTTVGDWNYGMAGGTEEGGNSYRDGGDDPGDITVNNAGIYRVLVNTASKTMSMTLVEDAVASYETICTSGTFNGWGADPMNKFSTYEGATENHDWYQQITFDADADVEADQGIKFHIGNWDVNWGGTTFPSGAGVAGGANIRYTAGTWMVFFNDIAGHYTFYKK